MPEKEIIKPVEEETEPVKDDEEIGVQEIQKGVREAAVVHAGGDSKDEKTDFADITHDVDSFSSKIDDVLQDAGLSRKHVYFCCGGVLVLGILFSIVFFGVKFFIGFVGGDDGAISDVSGDVTIVEVPVVETSGDQAWVDPSLYGGILLGTDFGLTGESGVDEGIEVGEVSQTYNDEYSYQIEHYGKVVNALDVDVNDYLNNFEDRTEAVDDLIADFQDIYEEGLEIVSDLEASITAYEVEFGGNADEKALIEERFFAELSAQDGDDTVAALEDFIKISQEQVDIKARYKAQDKLRELLSSKLLYLEARISDVTYNSEALVKGVQVVDVRGSDVEIIVDEELD